ncbi:hypothetical protein FAZ69_07415 [Trinickia terrae]|uniref:Uncharacterized protein n=1 Tax=Trinickia terrae TaxID=2571161 RepID=A0A4V5PK73_9BURK|nr:hypothetical protein [Trinickia terrae]TKC91180.1 hypothetical protein FAZ69_07415 [Trinickia terrae]
MDLHHYTDLPLDERAAFELACARRGFAPMHFDVFCSSEETIGGHSERHVTVRRGCWAQSYRADPPGAWVHQFETDLVCRFFK